MSDEPAQIIRSAGRAVSALGETLDGFGGVLRCEQCGTTSPVNEGAAGGYLANGWPRCCGYTKRWWTQRQINAGEFPPKHQGAE